MVMRSYSACVVATVEHADERTTAQLIRTTSQRLLCFASVWEGGVTCELPPRDVGRLAACRLTQASEISILRRSRSSEPEFDTPGSPDPRMLPGLIPGIAELARTPDTLSASAWQSAVCAYTLEILMGATMGI